MALRSRWLTGKRAILSAVAVCMGFAGLTASPLVSAATCATTTSPATTYGQVQQTVAVASSGTYRVWSRIKAPNSSSNSYYLQVDGGCAVVVGGSTSIPANSWTWVNYQGGNTSSYIDVSLAAGNHQLTYTGKDADVELDRVLLLGDTSCVPVSTGDNCANPDVTPPTVSVTAPAGGSTVSAGSTVTVTASAADNVAVTKVEFYVDNSLKATDTSSPYSYAWSTTGVTAGNHSITARAYDATGNAATSAPVFVTVAGASTPTPPGKTGTIRINAGGAAYTDPSGNQWGADGDVSGGSVDSQAAGHVIAGTANQALYQDERYGVFSYAIPVKNGAYTVRFHFAEIYSGCQKAGCRVFNVNAENKPIIQNLDIFSQVGGYKALDIDKPVTVSDGVLNLDFLSGGANEPQVAGIEVIPAAVQAPRRGDANGDNRVNAADLSILLSHSGTNYPPADFNHDGTVGAADLAILLSQWTW